MQRVGQRVILQQDIQLIGRRERLGDFIDLYLFRRPKPVAAAFSIRR
jgi:hypothetical protein